MLRGALQEDELMEPCYCYFFHNYVLYLVKYDNRVVQVERIKKKNPLTVYFEE